MRWRPFALLVVCLTGTDSSYKAVSPTEMYCPHTSEQTVALPTPGFGRRLALQSLPASLPSCHQPVGPVLTRLVLLSCTAVLVLLSCPSDAGSIWHDGVSPPCRRPHSRCHGTVITKGRAAAGTTEVHNVLYCVYCWWGGHRGVHGRRASRSSWSSYLQGECRCKNDRVRKCCTMCTVG